MRFNVKSLPCLATVWIAIGVALVIAGGVSEQSPGQVSEPAWSVDAHTGCKFWNTAPAQNETVS